MSLTLILSSYVAASRVGGFVQALALAAFGVEPVLAPTVLFGRHPGWGAPGGGPVDPDQFRSLLGGIAAQGLPGRADLLITGYFAHPDQVAAAAETIDQMRRDRPDGGYVVVDPVLGDEGKGLYVKPEVANAVRDLLTPRADLITPNRWELGWLSGCKVDTCDEIATAVQGMDRHAMVSSAPAGPDRIGVMEVSPRGLWLASHARLASAPNGVGDLLTALAAAARLDGLAAPNGLVRAVSGVAEAVEAASAWGRDDLPVVELGQALRTPRAPVTLDIL